jgi:hypothetical protein
VRRNQNHQTSFLAEAYLAIIGSSAKVAQQSPISQGKMGVSATFLCYFCGIAKKDIALALAHKHSPCYNSYIR